MKTVPRLAARVAAGLVALLIIVGPVVAVARAAGNPVPTDLLERLGSRRVDDESIIKVLSLAFYVCWAWFCAPALRQLWSALTRPSTPRRAVISIGPRMGRTRHVEPLGTGPRGLLARLARFAVSGAAIVASTTGISSSSASLATGVPSAVIVVAGATPAAAGVAAAAAPQLSTSSLVATHRDTPYAVATKHFPADRVDKVRERIVELNVGRRLPDGSLYRGGVFPAGWDVLVPALSADRRRRPPNRYRRQNRHRPHRLHRPHRGWRRRRSRSRPATTSGTSPRSGSSRLAWPPTTPPSLPTCRRSSPPTRMWSRIPTSSTSASSSTSRASARRHRPAPAPSVEPPPPAPPPIVEVPPTPAPTEPPAAEPVEAIAPAPVVPAPAPTTATTTSTTLPRPAPPAVHHDPIGTETPAPASPSPIGIGEAALLSAGVVALLAARRRLRLRASQPRARVPEPPSETVATERRLRAIDAGERLLRVDVAIRAAAASLVDGPARIAIVRIGVDGVVELTLTGEATLPPPWEGTGGRWALPGSTPVELLADAARSVGAPCVALAQLGVDDDGREVLADLEALGLLSVAAPDDVADAVVRGIAATLGTTIFAEVANFVGVGLDTEAFLGHRHAHQADAVDAALELATTLVGTTVSAKQQHVRPARPSHQRRGVGAGHRAHRLVRPRPGHARRRPGCHPTLRRVGDGQCRRRAGRAVVPAGGRWSLDTATARSGAHPGRPDAHGSCTSCTMCCGEPTNRSSIRRPPRPRRGDRRARRRRRGDEHGWQRRSMCGVSGTVRGSLMVPARPPARRRRGRRPPPADRALRAVQDVGADRLADHAP